MTPGQALDRQAFLAGWIRTRAANTMFNTVWRSVMEGRIIGEGSFDGVGEVQVNGQDILRGDYLRIARMSQSVIADVLEGPTPVYLVTPDMATLVTHAADQLEEAPTLQPWELPSPTGIMFMDVVLHDVDGSDYHSCAFTWTSRYPIGSPDPAGETAPGIMLTIFIDAVSFGIDADRFGSPWLPMDITGWQFGRDTVATGLKERLLERGDDAYRHVIGTRKLLYAVWHLCQERIEREPADRQARRRYERATRRPAPRVAVVDIRRRSNPHPAGTQEHREWTHRWIVSGHWRRQWYASVKEHRPIWIDPYVKGPEDLPLGEPGPTVKVVRP